MRGLWLVVAAVATAFVPLLAAGADWRAPEPENTLVFDTTQGRIVVELAPVFAPKGVERVKRLAREGVYDGLLFHRVIDGFVAQTGNPNNKDGGVSSHPDLPPEFTFKLQPDISFTKIVDASDALGGFIGASPFLAEPPEIAVKLKRPPRAWGLYCAGALGMGRQEAINTANSEIFFMREPSHRLDHTYTYIGQVLTGLEAVRALAVGEPPTAPDVMTKVRVMADMPEAERPRLDVMDTASRAFQAQADQARKAKGADFSLCDVPVPVRGGK